MKAYCYILYSQSYDKFYIGFTTLSVEERLKHHLQHYYDNKYTKFTDDWKVFLEIECKDNEQARNVEKHIKKMKSKVYIRNLKKYPEIIEKLLNKYNS